MSLIGLGQKFRVVCGEKAGRDGLEPLFLPTVKARVFAHFGSKIMLDMSLCPATVSRSRELGHFYGENVGGFDPGLLTIHSMFASRFGAVFLKHRFISGL